MRTAQAEQISHMRRTGNSYGRIADSLGLPLNTVKSFCRRRGITAETSASLCECCGAEVKQMEHRKTKRFCSEEQLTSYETQVDYYTSYIQSREDWDFVAVYTDEGITGCSTKRREGFKRMVADALAGKIEILQAVWIQSHDSQRSEPPFEYPLNPLFSHRSMK